MGYENDSYEDEIDRMRARRQNKKHSGSYGKRGTEKGSGGAGRPPYRSNRSHSQRSYSQPEDRTDYSQEKLQAEKRRRKRRRKKTIAPVLLIVLVIAAGWFVIQHFQQGGYWTIAVFGVDSREGALEKGTLSDVEMICSIDRKTGEIRLASVFRDSYLKIDSEGTYDKINEAYFLGGHEQGLQALQDNLDLQIDDYATFNWKAVVDAINILGGVDVEITDKEFAYINSFITETVNSTGVGSVQLKKSGMNHLDGVQAVAYARLRLMDTDFNRTERQRRVLGLAMEKAKHADFATLKSLVTAVYPQVSTSIGLDDLISLARHANKYYIGQTSGFPFSHQEMKIDKKSCVIPTTLESNVVQLHSFLYNDNQYTVSSRVKSISSHIAEVTGLGTPGNDTESGKNVGTEGNLGGSSGGGASQPAAAPETQPAAEPESSDSQAETEPSAEESSEKKETIKPLESESSQKESKETETSSEDDKHPITQGTAADNRENGPGAAGHPSQGGPGEPAPESSGTSGNIFNGPGAAASSQQESAHLSSEAVGPGV